MKKSVLVLIFVSFYFVSLSQNKISGTVYDNSTKEVLPTVVVYIPNLHKGTMTDKDGKFEIDDLSIKSFKLIVSLIGYQTKVVDVNKDKLKSAINIYLDAQTFQTQEVIISGNKFSLQHENALDIQSIKQNIETDLNTGFLQALSNQQGVDMISKGNGIQKPVIRGLSNTNILFVENGIRKENFQFSENHPYLTDELGIDRIEIIKGPASLLYGSDAVGGVIFLIPEKPTLQNTISGNFKAKYSFNDGGIVSSAFLKGAKKKVHFGIGGSEKSYMDYYDANNEQVPNSRFNNIAAKANVGFSYKIGKSDLYYSYNLMKLGLTIPDAFSKITSNSRKNELWYQDLNSHIIALKNKLFFNSLMIDADFSFQQNNRKLNASYDLPVFNVVDMRLSSTSYNIKATYNLKSKYDIILGTQGMLQSNKNFDAPNHVIPDATKNDFSVYSLFSSNITNKFHLLLGARFDYRKITTIAELNKPLINKEYSNISYSGGFTYQVSNEFLIRSNFASAFRTPNIAELTQNGPHGQYFEKGNSNLLKQQNFEPDLSIHYHNKNFLFELSGFYNKINNYIFLDKTNNYTNDGIQILQYMQSDATIKGFEAGVKLMPIKNLKFFANYSFLDAKKTNDEYLPFIPQNKIQSEINFKPKKQFFKFNFSSSIHFTYAFAQDKFAYSETYTPQYELVNFHINFSKKIQKGKLSIGVGVNNIFNSVYIDHLSTLKGSGYFFQGRNVITVVKYVF